ncbi:MAG: Zn-ribbon domain-containing OB-fold protein [Haloarculaceae archaeon]
MSLDAHVCPNGHVTCPGHPRCPECGREQTAAVDLADRTGTVVTWTHSTRTPPGVREPNTVAVVEFEVGDAVARAVVPGDGSDSAGHPHRPKDRSVRVVGGVTTADVETGDTVEPVYVEQLRDPEAGIREADSQDWDGYRFDPV